MGIFKQQLRPHFHIGCLLGDIIQAIAVIWRLKWQSPKGPGRPGGQPDDLQIRIYEYLDLGLYMWSIVQVYYQMQTNTEIIADYARSLTEPGTSCWFRE